MYPVILRLLAADRIGSWPPEPVTRGGPVPRAAPAEAKVASGPATSSSEKRING